MFSPITSSFPFFGSVGHPAMRAFACASRARRAEVADVAVVGGGAAGLTAAWYAARPGADVLVLERTRECGKKVLMSGGTRCNVLPCEADVTKDFFSSAKMGALRSIFSSWDLKSARKWMEDDLGLPLVVEESTRKVFPKTQSSRDVRDALVRGCERKQVEFQYHASVEKIQRINHGPLLDEPWCWRCTLDDGTHVDARNVVLAAGGASFPKVGTDGSSFSLAQDLGHTIHTPFAALTPLLGNHPGTDQLAGVSLEVALQVATRKIEEGQPSLDRKLNPKKKRKKKQVNEAVREGFLFTHKGYSGPAVLDLSHHFVQHMDGLTTATRPELLVNWANLSEQEWKTMLDPSGGGGGMLVANKLRATMPQRLAVALCEELGISGCRLAELTKQDRAELLSALVRFPLDVKGHAGLDKAEVTGGGVSLHEINTTTMESRLQENIFLCGEVLDCFGRIGGFNFYFAWVTGRLAGKAAAASASQFCVAAPGRAMP